MVIVGRGDLDMIAIRQSLSLAIALGRPVTLCGALDFFSGAAGCRPLMSDIEDFITGFGLGDFSVDGGDLVFCPKAARYGTFEFSSGEYSSAVEIALLMLPSLAMCDFRSRLVLRGVTHSPLSHTTSLLKETLFELYGRAGLFASCSLRRFGMYGSGGGEMEVRVYPLEPTGADIAVRCSGAEPFGARVYVSGLDTEFAHRQREALARELGIPDSAASLMQVMDADGPGNVLEAYLRAGDLPLVLARAIGVVDHEGRRIFSTEQALLQAIDIAEEARSLAGADALPEPLLRELALLPAFAGCTVDIPPSCPRAAAAAAMAASFAG